jgi:uncharacterized protein (TIGR03083 family)
MTSSQPSAQIWIDALRASEQRLAGLLAGLDAEALSQQSYDSEWTIAQVASHLGSGAQIFGLFMDAGMYDAAMPGIEVLQPIWDLWNGRSPVEQRDSALASSEAFTSRLESLTPDERASFLLDLFGTEVDVAGLARMRLAEHAVHTWDIAVALDPTATVSPDAVALLVDGLGQVAARTGKPSEVPFRVLVSTTDPVRSFVISVADAVSLEPVGHESNEPSYDGTLALPAEALLRLIGGRLDDDNTPAVTHTGTRGLADLQATFVGY